jgi:hypothetical protein
MERMTAKDPNERYINCRELLWELKSQERKYVIPTTPMSRPEQEKTTPKKTITKVNNPVPHELMEKIQLELARMIGPIAKVVLTKECKRLGYSRASFPDDKLSPLIKQLKEHVEESKQEQFNDKVQDTIYDFRRKKA